MTASFKLDRRSFLAGAASLGGLSLGFRLPFGLDAVAAAETAPTGATPEVNAWVVIRPDDTVVIRIARSEMGQGTLTGLAQLVAEELECDWSRVTTEFPTPGENAARKRVWGNFSTGGSRGIRESNEYVRKGGAAARDMLIRAAAVEWGVPPGECGAANSVITHAPSGRTTTYGKVADAAAKLDPPGEVTLKDPKDWKIAGKKLKRLDTPDKVNGKTVYGIDIRMPGMLTATIRDCPVQGGKLKSFDAARVGKMRGVKQVVAVGDSAVAVVADGFWNAKTAIAALPIVWDEGPNASVSSADIAAMLQEGLDARTHLSATRSATPRRRSPAPRRWSRRFTAIPYQSHAPMEPMNATALYTAEKCEVWCPTQNAEATLATVADAAGLPVAKCDVHKTFLGGGFGRRGAGQDYARQAVLIAKQMPGMPVKLIWTREEDTTHDFYHPITQCKLRGGLDAAGNLVGLHMRISGQSIRAALLPENSEGRDGRGRVPGAYREKPRRHVRL